MRPGARAGRAARRRRRAGDARWTSTPGASRGGHRFLRAATSTIATRRRLRADARSRRQGHRRLRRAPRRDRRRRSKARPATRRRSCPTRCSTKSRRWSSGPSSTRARSTRVPRGAAGVPDPHHAAEPAYSRWPTTRGKLVNRFLIVSNIETRRPVGDRQRQRARAAPAAGRREVLLRPGPQEARSQRGCRSSRSVVYHNKLGTQAERVGARCAGSPRRIQARCCGADRRAYADRAAQLAKADLVTHMVGEFPELQGVMGRYYAEHDGEAPTSPRAIEQHYWPRFAGDALPDGRGRASPWRSPTSSTRWSACSASARCPPATRIRSALRRAALGVVRILLERRARRCRSARRCVERRVRMRSRRARWLARDARGVYGFMLERLRRLPARPGLRRRTKSRPCSARRPGAHRPRADALDAVQAFARAARSRSARRRQQAHRRTSCARAAARPRPPSIAALLGRRRRARPLHGVPEARAAGRGRLRARATSPARCARSRPPSRPSTASSTTSW